MSHISTCSDSWKMIDFWFPSEDLMAGTAEGDEYAFEVLVRRHQSFYPESYLSLCRRQDEGQRPGPGSIYQGLAGGQRYKPKAKFTTWIYRITANLCLNELKSSAARNVLFRRFSRRRADPERGKQCLPIGGRSSVGRGTQPSNLRCSPEPAGKSENGFDFKEI